MAICFREGRKWFLILMMALAVLTLVFGGLCLGKGLSQGFSVNLLDFLVADIVYIMPNMLMIVCVYAIAALIFKNPLPATPLLFLYIIYSNMGGTGADADTAIRQAVVHYCTVSGKIF